MLDVEDWAEIRRLHRAEGMAIRAIARRLGIARNTVRKALVSHSPPRYERAPSGSIVDEVEPAIRALLAEFPEMPTSVLMERVGWRRGRSVFYERVARLRPLFRPPDPVSRTEYRPGELAQCDLWFPPVDVPLRSDQHGRPPVLVMVAGYSRVITAVMLPSRQSPDLLAGHWRLLSGWAATPRALVWDNESAVGQWRAGKPRLTETMNAFRGSLGIKVIQCRPGDPEAKGLVERANGYLETSFFARTPLHQPTRLQHPAHRVAGAGQPGHHRRLGARPIERWPTDRAAMLELPPVAPVTGWRHSTRLPRDHYVRLDANDYSVHPTVIGRLVHVRADLATVVVTCDGTEVARHQRCWAAHQTITDPAHQAAAARMRQTRRPMPVPATDTEVAHRDLADYDRLFGLSELTGESV